MKFTETPLPGAFVIELQKREDDRGFFARFFCKEELAVHGLSNEIVQVNNSLSRVSGTLRGMHFQKYPKGEDKIVRCIRGSFLDVIIDLRPESKSFMRHFSIMLSAENRVSLYVPKGFAHGFMTMEPDTEAFYLVTEKYSPECERGVRYNDPAFGIHWPMEPVEISSKDCSYPAFDSKNHSLL
jgi:dTDP-4-dehydrorhamnose 3,5-epimerase